MNLFKLAAMYRAYFSGAPLGDVVVLKLDALHAAPRDVAEKLRAFDGYAAPDLAVLRRMPEGTLGNAYARFLDANGIAPLVVSPAVRERFRRDPYALRYTATHDVHHVLAGFDTGLAGEAGVLAFNVGQGVAPVPRWMLGIVKLLFVLVSPSQARAIARNVRVGLAMGERASLVIGAPIETWFGESIDDVRERLGIPEPGAAGVVASGRSGVMKVVARA